MLVELIFNGVLPASQIHGNGVIIFSALVAPGRGVCTGGHSKGDCIAVNPQRPTVVHLDVKDIVGRVRRRDPPGPAYLEIILIDAVGGRIRTAAPAEIHRGVDARHQHIGEIILGGGRAADIQP